MLKKTVTYEDFDGNERTEDFYFHLSKSELVKWFMTGNNYTMDKVLERLTKTQNRKEIMKIFEDLLHRSYGVKSMDGRQFVKTKEEWESFFCSPAYDKIFMELISDGKMAAEFVNAIIPRDLSEEIDKMMKEQPENIPDDLKKYVTDVRNSPSHV